MSTLRASHHTGGAIDEFDAVRAMVELLKPLTPDARQRAIRWSQEILGVADSPPHPFSDDSFGQLGGRAQPPGHELADLLQDVTFVQRRGVVNRMLEILSVAHRLKPTLFDKVLSIRGRNRRYFAKTEAEIANSGNSTQPRNIPGTGYWVMTNSPTSQKREMLGQVLRLLGFSPHAIRDAVAAIEK